MSIIGRHLSFLQASQSSAATTFNSLDKGTGLTLSGGDLVVAQSVSSTWRSIRATKGRNSGKFVYELTCSSLTGNLLAGFASGAALMSTFLGGSSLSVGHRTNGAAYVTNGVTTAGSPPSSSTNPYMFALDLDAGKGWIALASVWANTGDPAAGTNPSFTWTGGTTIYPAASVFTTGGITITLNAGASAFSNTVPSGFNAGWD